MRARINTAALLSLFVVSCATTVPTATPNTAPPSVTPASVPATTAVAPGMPAFAEVPCPDEVTIVMVVRPTCGFLTVEERRDDPTGPEVRVFVVRIDPTAVAADDPMVVVGEALGGRLEYGGLAPLAQRTGRVAYLVDRRGTGRSEPGLTCPEMDADQHRMIEGPSFEPGAIAELADTVRACRNRLVAAGVDPAAYDIAASALDIEDLRIALGIETWNVIAFGSASRLAVEVARLAPDGIRTLVLDSIVTSGRDDPIAGIAATRHAVAEVAQACAADAGCRAALTDFGSALATAVATLDRDPLEVSAGTGGPGSVVIDGTRFARMVRSIIGQQGGQRIDVVTAAVARVVQGALAPEDPVVAEVRAAVDLCFGLLPNCTAMQTGSMVTTVCRDILPFVGPSPSPDDAFGLGRGFRLDEWTAVCDAWAVPPADDGPDASRLPDLPVLVMNGQFDPYTGPLDALDALRPPAGRGLFLEVPNQGYNAFGFDECPRSVRRAWLDDPSAFSLDTSCFADLRSVRVWTAPVSR